MHPGVHRPNGYAFTHGPALIILLVVCDGLGLVAAAGKTG